MIEFFDLNNHIYFDKTFSLKSFNKYYVLNSFKLLMSMSSVLGFDLKFNLFKDGNAHFGTSTSLLLFKHKFG